MSGVTGAAADNIRFLEQAELLLRQLNDEEYVKGGEGLFRGGVGAQLRHCLDFYRCFLDGLEGRTIDYGHRRRERRIETHRAEALKGVRATIRELAGLSPRLEDRELEVLAEADSEEQGRAVASRSTVLRELRFLASHTVHHFALIAALLHGRGFPADRRLVDFGVAPSTLAHWKADRSRTS